MSKRKSPSFNAHTSLAKGEYVVDTNCPKCGSPIRNVKTDDCASCPKFEAANTKADCEFNAKRRRLELEKEIRDIERDLSFDLVEY
ncbi:hypothetical protein [Reinekea sp.]|jgi:uncharacterized Zn finger protein (UPF0148 family)|uniref:hypothetical protein n=1 Tax=Reinekea sp. TaxID=1970455 RepID=UPI003989FC58